VKSEVNRALITTARESRGYSQETLAQRMGISQSKLSKYENGTLRVSRDDLSRLSEATGYTEDFFLQGTEVFGFGTICIFHRKKASLPVSALKVIQAKLNVVRMQTPRLLERIAVETDRPLPVLDVDEFGGPAKVAREVRRLWQMPLGPVQNLTGIIERSGVIVRKVDFGTGRIDAVSQKIAGYPPVFLVNAAAPGDRLRFSLAHELAHVVMHHAAPSADMEREADEFASEFLMPADEIGPVLRKLTLDRLPPLKARWRVSMQALIKRAADLGRITERHYRTLFMQMSKNGWRLREPITIDIEEPTVMRDVVAVHLRDHGYSVEELARRSFLRDPAEFRAEYAPDYQTGLRIVG